jgi:hypothetical protein
VELKKSKLLGNWSICQANETELFPLYHKEIYKFVSEEMLELHTEFSFDKDCATVMTKESLAKKLADIKDTVDEEILQEYKIYFESAVGGFLELYPYKAELVDEGKLGTIDISVEESVIYTSYKVEGNKLFLSETCDVSEPIVVDDLGDAPSEGPISECIESGISPETRGKTLTDIPLLRLP